MDGIHGKNHISTDAGGDNEQEREENNAKLNSRRHKKKKSAKVRNSVNCKPSGYSDWSKSSSEMNICFNNVLSGEEDADFWVVDECCLNLSKRNLKSLQEDIMETKKLIREDCINSNGIERKRITI
ncbi:hypothetical protein HHI36_008026 [Cryptolaemus montrouzieri]|uniref:Uncharacterized protein n=1 Tax=Cryptolaemus montrouzieri TaxID=559131 RepID=A0ABD2MRU5_9CUCU